MGRKGVGLLLLLLIPPQQLRLLLKIRWRRVVVVMVRLLLARKKSKRLLPWRGVKPGMVRMEDRHSIPPARKMWGMGKEDNSSAGSALVARIARRGAVRGQGVSVRVRGHSSRRGRPGVGSVGRVKTPLEGVLVKGLSR